MVSNTSTGVSVWIVLAVVITLFGYRILAKSKEKKVMFYFLDPTATVFPYLVVASTSPGPTVFSNPLLRH
jgi:Na+/proline symporter